MKKGIFLGAGASYEVGMPLVWEFSNTLRINVLKRLDSRLFNFEAEPALKDVLIRLLKDESKHYEEVVGELEKIYIKNRTGNSPTHGVLIQLIECIQILLLEEQMNTLKLLGEKIKDYYGLVDIVKEQGVLNVFSLNHDIVFEEICNYYGIPYRDGFFDLEHKYKNVANFRAIKRDQLEAGNINIFDVKDYGVNLIKLHGSFDIFAAEDKALFLKSYSPDGDVGSSYQEIRKIEDVNHKVCNREGVRTTNELLVNDDNGELQFLRRSLLSGAHKFQNRFEQIAPIAFFNAFERQLHTLNELVVIGYGFGDSHINEVLSLWIENASNKIIIYDPFRKSIPDCLSSHTSQVEIVHGGLTEFCLSANSSKECFVTKGKRKILHLMREKLREKRLEKGV